MNNIDLIKQRDAKLMELKEINSTLLKCPFWLFRKRVKLIFRMETVYNEIDAVDHKLNHLFINHIYENQTYNKLHELLKNDYQNFIINAYNALKPEARELYLLYEMYMNFFLYYNYKFKVTMEALIEFVNQFPVQCNGIATEEQVKSYFKIA